MSSRVREHIRNNLWGIVAVYIALGGVAWAVQVAPKNSVVSKSIKNGQVKKADVGAGAVNASKVAADALTGAQIDESTLGQVPNAAQLGGSPASAYLKGSDTVGGTALTGTYASPAIANGSISTAKFDPDSHAPDSDRLGGLNPAAYGAGVMSGRISGLTGSGVGGFASPSGASSAAATALEVAFLSPGVPTVARDLNVMVTDAPGSGQLRQFTLNVDGTDTSLTCVMSDPATTCGPTVSSAAIPAGSRLAISESGTVGATPTTALFGFRLTR
jgi:hypothetical protein